MEQGDPAPLHGPGRAQRYALHLPVLFRRVGDPDWRSGTTENLSDSGAVIRAATPLMPATQIEVIISLPSSATQSGGCLMGKGQVVRTYTPLPKSDESVFAVTFNQYRLERRDSVIDASRIT